ncbi:MAG TPA: copper chaperone PCu(A)C, partial [Streptosporangiaceae bacterium]|nr:copper chaperone PCu(A)C [Streptosporangiaceae bacterium]
MRAAGLALARRAVATTVAVAALVAGLGAVAGCAARAGASQSIEVATAYVPVPQASGTTVAYVVIRNNGSADRLVAAHTSAGGRVTFRTARGPGASVMSTIGSVRIPGHATLAMRP